MPQHSEEKYHGFKRFGIVLIILLVVTVLFKFLNIFQSADLQLFDFFQAITGKTSASEDVILIKVDDATVTEYGWPAPRARYAELI